MKFTYSLCAYLLTGATLAYGWRQCREDQFWFSITGDCEPCSRICDPPGRHETDCPRICPNYTSSTKSVAQQTEGGVTRSGSTGSSSISMTTVALIGVMVFVTLGVGCVLYKKRKPVKECFPLRKFYGKKMYRPTAVAEQPTDAALHRDQDPEHKEMLPDQACGDLQPATR